MNKKEGNDHTLQIIFLFNMFTEYFMEKSN